MVRQRSVPPPPSTFSRLGGGRRHGCQKGAVSKRKLGVWGGEFFEADLVFQRNRFLVIPLLVALRNQHRWPNEANTHTHTTHARTHTHNHNEEAMKMLNIGKMFFIISLSLSLRYELLSMYQQKMQFKNILFQPRQSGLIARTYVVDPLKKRASTSVQSLSKKREWNWTYTHTYLWVVHRSS